MRVLLVLLVAALAATPAAGQQPNCDPVKLVLIRWITTPNPECIGNNTLPGPHFAQLPTVWSGGGSANLAIYGASNQEGWVFAQQGMPSVGSMTLPGGIVDVDVTRAVLMWHSITNPVSGSMSIAYILYPSSYAIFATAFPFTFQGVMVDPASPVGYTLTAAICISFV